MRKLLLFTFFVCNFSWVLAQERSVSGKVTADDGSPLPGVNVVLKGTANGTVTDSNGQYKLSVSGGVGTLIFSFIGMTTQEVELAERSAISVQMQADAKQLQEVVVNALGDVQDKDKLGIASASVQGNSVVSSGETGVINGLAGKAPGVTITRNGGDPGAGSFIQLRGQSTITGDLQPLIVIDGMPMFNSNIDQGAGNQIAGVQQQSRLNDINPDDIASVEIIKSAAGAALWGSRAANGVIVITTKRGKSNKGKINIGYSGTVDFDQVNKMPALQTTFGEGSHGAYAWNSSSSWGDKISSRVGGADTYVTPGMPGYLGYAQLDDGSKIYRISKKNSTNTFDHRKDVFGTGHFEEHNINLSGGNDRSLFYVSYSNLDQKGIIKNNSDYIRNTARVNFSTSITERLHASANVNFSNVRSNRVQQGSQQSGVMLGELRTPGDYNNNNYQGEYFDPTGLGTLNTQLTYRNQIGSGTPGYDNPIWNTLHNKSFSIVNRFLGNAELNYDLFSWMVLKANAGVDTYADRRGDFYDAQSASFPGGAYTEQYIQETQWNTNLYAIANHSFSDAFKGSMTLGFNYNNRQFNNVGAQAIGFIIPDAPPNLANSLPTNRQPFNSETTVRTSAGFATMTGEYKDQLFVTLTGRAESASTFGPQAQSLFFYPSASGAWQFSKLIGVNNFLSFGKLRTSYGVVGLQPGPYLNLTQYGVAGLVDAYGPTLNASNYGVGGYAISPIAGNPLIKPERKHEFETGLDLRFFENRVAFSATGYFNKTTDVILQTQVANTSGFTLKTGNVGAIQNKGLELSLEPTWVRSPNGFTWSTNFIWYAYRNKVLDLAGATSVTLSGFSNGASAAIQGQPLGVLYGIDYVKDPKGKYVLDANGFPTVAPNNSVIGNPNPQYRASAGNTFAFKGIRLYALFDFQMGGQMWNGTRGALVNYGTAAETARETTVTAADAATIKTVTGATIATTPGSIVNSDGSYTFRGQVQNFGGGRVALNQDWYTAGGSGFLVNAPFVEKASWARLRELTLSYTINSQNFREATKLSSITLGVTGRNLLLWTPYKGIDPDTNLTGATNGRGIDYFQNPNTRSILFKVGVNF